MLPVLSKRNNKSFDVFHQKPRKSFELTKKENKKKQSDLQKSASFRISIHTFSKVIIIVKYLC